MNTKEETLTYEQLLQFMHRLKANGLEFTIGYQTMRREVEAMKIPSDFICDTCGTKADIFVNDAGDMNCATCDWPAGVISIREFNRINYLKRFKRERVPTLGDILMTAINELDEF